jgi:hypothetical protein
MALGEYRLGQPLWSLRIADAYRADGPQGPATVYVIHAAIAANTAGRDQIIAGTRVAAGLPEHEHRVRTLAAGLTGDVLWIATEELDGQSVRDMLANKRLGARATVNLIVGVAKGLADAHLPPIPPSTPAEPELAHHGALAPESVIVDRQGRVRVVDLALGAGTVAAMAAGLIPAHHAVAPEVLAGGPPSGAGDVYSIGALLYECLVGAALERGGPRPSEVAVGVTAQVDDLVARACHKDPDRRFARPDVLGDAVREALAPAGSELPPVAAPATVDRAPATDATENWLISKGKLDYGPFSLADVIKQIESGEIVAGNLIMDKDSGARSDVGTHPLLGPMVEVARQKRDDARRAQAEVVAARSDKKRGAVLYGVIGLGVAGAALGAWLIIKAASGDKAPETVGGVAKLDNAQLDVKVTMPKAPPKKTGGRRGGGGGGNYTKGSEDLSLDMSGDDDESGGSLDMGVVYRVYSRYGRQLGGCTGGSAASISIIIDGPSGRVTFVKVNGSQSGAMWACLNGVLRGMQFPTLKSGRTRAEFDIGA